jgi:molybdenum cofactor cytidylyltransferase
MLNTGFQAIILAAGQSSRMRREKSRLPWIEGKPLLPWMVDALSAAGWQTTVVVGPESFARWESTLPAGCVVLNPNPARGKSSSLACGMEKLPPDTKWILISAVDQPRLPELYHHLREEAETCAAKIIVPTRQGSRGHPVVLAGALRHELLALKENSHGLRGLLDAHRSETYRLPGGGAAEWQWDLNTPDAYEEALAFFQGHAVSE